MDICNVHIMPTNDFDDDKRARKNIFEVSSLKKKAQDKLS